MSGQRKGLVGRFRYELRPYQRTAATLGAAAIAPVVATRFDPVLTSTVTKIFLRLLPQRRATVAASMAVDLNADPTELLRAADRYWLQRVETRWGQARGISLTGWRPSVDLHGADHIFRALERGNGVILWRVSGHSAIPLNQALVDAGLAPVHLSSRGHLLLARPSRLWRFVGLKVAPLLRRGEDRLLRERIEINPRSAAGATRQVVAALAENSVVTIVGDLKSGAKTHTLQVNSATLKLANGGAKIAERTGAALLPVTVRRVGPLAYRIDVHDKLRVDPDSNARTRVEQRIEGFAAVLADFIKSDPAQWPKWRAPLS